MTNRPWSPILGASVACCCLLLVACAPSEEGPSGGSGGATPSGSGGEASSGGSGGGPVGSGGAVSSSGGRSGSGGAAGQPGSGGSAATGGADQPGSGGAAGRGTGGRSASGGATGSGGAPASGGQGGAGTGAGGASSAPKPSAGCGMTTSQAAGQWVVQSSLTVAGTARPYSVRLPTGYNPSRAYPVLMLLHGCSSGTNNVAMERVAGSDAVMVRGTGSAADTCWQTAANSNDVMFVDAMVADVKAHFCSDENRFFAVGYSSGSWLANQLTCIRPTVFRGAGTVTGGESSNGRCTGGVARVFVHDTGDTTNVISGSERARDRQLTQNGCDKAVQPVAHDPSPCVAYSCPAAYPVIWCPTTGQMHNRQDNFAPGVFWNVFNKL
jgi:polyhydroxybutyrate depolymerase